MNTYKAIVTGKEGNWYVVEIPQLGRDAVTQAIRLEEVEDEAIDYIAVTLDIEPGSFNVEVEVRSTDVSESL